MRLAIALLVWPLLLSSQIAFRKSARAVEIEGPGWTLRYQGQYHSNFLVAGKDRAFFSHGRILRWIDTDRGIVLARWLMGATILRMNDPAPGSGRVEVELRTPYAYGSEPPNTAIVVDPAAPQIPYQPLDPWMSQGGECEAMFAMPSGPGSLGCNPRIPRLTSEQLSKAIPDVEDMVQRDSLSPWFHATLGQLLRRAKDSRAGAEFQKAVQLGPGTDFSELLPISALLESIGESEAAEIAFQTGFQDFLAHGHDPRLVMMNPGRLYAVSGPGAAPRNPKDRQRWLMLAPAFEAQDRAWLNLAKRWIDRPFLLSVAVLLAAFLQLLALFGKYFQPGRQDIALGRSLEGPGGHFRCLRVEYWNWTERVSFFVLIAIGWMSLGIAGGHLRGVERIQAMPYSARLGSLAGPVFASYAEHRLPASPERDLLLEIGRKQNTGKRVAIVAPSQEQIERAFLGGGREKFATWSLGGPFSAATLLQMGNRGRSPLAWIRLFPWIYAVLLPLGGAILLMPKWSVPVDRGVVRWIREALFPGLSPSWGFLGGIAWIAWCYCLLRIFMFSQYRTLEIVGWIFIYGPYGEGPSPPWLYAAPAAIWLLNAVVISVFRPAWRGSDSYSPSPR